MTLPSPQPPQRTLLPPDDPRTKLRNNVADAIGALPFYFKSTINIEGLDAADLFSLNTRAARPVLWSDVGDARCCWPLRGPLAGRRPVAG